MNSISNHYNDDVKGDVKETETEEDPLVVPHIRTIEADCHCDCDICKIRLAGIFQEDGNYCLECWQERTHPS
jgi:hypothetical protein